MRKRGGLRYAHAGIGSQLCGPLCRYVRQIGCLVILATTAHVVPVQANEEKWVARLETSGTIAGGGVGELIIAFDGRYATLGPVRSAELPCMGTLPQSQLDALRRELQPLFRLDDDYQRIPDACRDGTNGTLHLAWTQGDKEVARVRVRSPMHERCAREDNRTALFKSVISVFKLFRDLAKSCDGAILK